MRSDTRIPLSQKTKACDFYLCLMDTRGLQAALKSSQVTPLTAGDVKSGLPSCPLPFLTPQIVA